MITVCDLGRIPWRRSNVTARPPQMLAEERVTWQEAHRTGQSASTYLDAETGLERVRCWPIHEPEWKREILQKRDRRVLASVKSSSSNVWLGSRSPPRPSPQGNRTLSSACPIKSADGR